MTEEKTLEFWNEIRHQFNPRLFCDPPTRILSPGQARLHQLAFLRVPKFQYIFEMVNAGYKFCLIEKSLFEKYFDAWHASGLLVVDTLEERYKKMLPPDFMPRLPEWDELLIELGGLIKEQRLTQRFAQLWASYNKTSNLMMFINIVDPYNAANKSAEKNDSSEVERYIYAHWMHSHSYIGKKGDKSRLGTLLASKLDEALNNYKGTGNRPWQFTHYESLILTENEENPLIRTVTDMTPLMITEYATDGAFDEEDFPELFSVT